jgi:hypothetical protein
MDAADKDFNKVAKGMGLCCSSGFCKRNGWELGTLGKQRTIVRWAFEKDVNWLVKKDLKWLILVT